MSKKIDNAKKVWILALIIVALGMILRSWRLSELFHFTYDEEIIAFVGKRIWINGHIPLIGGVTPMHVHLAPYFYWLSSIPLILTKLNPLGWGIFAVMIAGITMTSLFLLGKRIFGQRTAFIALDLCAFSFFQNIFDRHYWGLVFNGLVSLAVLYSLNQLVGGKQKFIYVLVVALAFGFHTDPSTLVLFVLTLLVFLIYKPAVSKKMFINGFLILAISFLPLIFFEIRHDLANSRGILQYIDEIKQGRRGAIQATASDSLLFVPRALSRTLFLGRNIDLATEYSYCPRYAQTRLRHVSPFLLAITFAIILYPFWVVRTSRVEKKVGLMVILLFILVTYLGTLVYGILFKGDLFDHYVSTIFPSFLLLTAVCLESLRTKIPTLFYLFISLFIFLNVISLSTAYHRFGFSDKEKAVKWAIGITGGNDFSLNVIGSCFRYNGYRYLFYLFGKEPVKSYVDANFTHLYDNPPAPNQGKIFIVITNPDTTETEAFYKEYAAYKEQLLASSKFGEIEVLVVDNSNMRYTGGF